MTAREFRRPSHGHQPRPPFPAPDAWWQQGIGDSSRQRDQKGSGARV